MMRRVMPALALLCGMPASALAQGPVAKLTLQGAGSQTGTGAFRCAPGEEGQMSLGGTDSTREVVPLEPYAPHAESSNERVVKAVVPDYSSYIVNVTCVGDGEAWITVRAGDAELRMAALVGTARRKPNPKWNGTVTTGTTVAVRSPAVKTAGSVVTPADSLTTPAMPKQVSTAPNVGTIERRPGTPLRQVVPDAPAVAATGLTLLAGYDRSVVLRWRPAPGAVGYRIARKDVAANTLVTVTGEAVSPDGQGLITDTVYVDRWLETGKTYAYYLATYFRSGTGAYYFPDRASEQHGLATPRDPASLAWLPTGWADPVSLASTTIRNDSMVVTWRSKFAAQRYGIGSVLVTSPSAAGSCSSADMHFFFDIPDTTFTKNIPGTSAEGGRVNTYCFTIRGKYPDQTGTPRLGSYLLYVPVSRDCPSDNRQPCGPWRVLPTASIRENQPGHLVRLVDEEP